MLRHASRQGQAWQAKGLDNIFCLSYNQSMGNSSKQNFTGTFPKPLLDALRELAHQHERSINKELNRAVRLYVERNKPKVKPAPEEAAS